MIRSKADLVEYMEADKNNLGRITKKPSIFDTTWKFEIALRKLEYYSKYPINSDKKD